MKVNDAWRPARIWYVLIPWILILLNILLSNAIVVTTKFAYKFEEIHPLFFVMLRNWAGAIFLAPLIVPVFFRTFKRHNYRMSFLRNFTAILAMSLWSFAYSNIPLATATSLTFAVPIFTMILAYFVLGEKITRVRWAVVLMGFLAVLISLRPSFGHRNMYYLIIFGCIILWSLSNIFRKISSKTTSVQNFLCYYSFWSCILTSLVAIPFFQLISLKALGLVVVGGALTAFINYASFSVYKHHDVSVVQGLDFLRLIIVAMADYFVFGDLINSNVVIGSTIVIACSIFLIYYEGKNYENSGLK